MAHSCARSQFSKEETQARHELEQEEGKSSHELKFQFTTPEVLLGQWKHVRSELVKHEESSRDTLVLQFTTRQRLLEEEQWKEREHCRLGPRGRAVLTYGATL